MELSGNEEEEVFETFEDESLSHICSKEEDPIDNDETNKDQDEPLIPQVDPEEIENKEVDEIELNQDDANEEEGNCKFPEQYLLNISIESKYLSYINVFSLFPYINQMVFNTILQKMICLAF